MSLMNDALRKRDRETTESPAAPGFSNALRRPKKTRIYLGILLAVILITAAALAGIHLMPSDTDALLVKSPLAKPSGPPADQTANASSSPETDHPAGTGAEQAPTAGRPPTNASGDMPATTEIATDHPAPAPPSGKRRVDATGIRPQTAVEVTATSDKKPTILAISHDSTPTESRIETPSKPTGTVSPAYEPGPNRPVPLSIEKRPSSLSKQARIPADKQPSPTVPSQTIAAPKPNQAGRKTPDFNQDADPFYIKARAYHRSGRLSDAIRLYRQVLKSNPDHLDAMLNLAAATMQQGNYLDAQVILKRLEQARPRPQGVLLNLAISAIGMGAPEQALTYLDRANAMSDASPWEIRFHRAVAYARMNRLQEALLLYRQAEAERPDAPQLQFNLAVTCDTLGLYPEALAHYKAVLQGPSAPSETEKETITQRIRTIGRYLYSTQSPAKG